MKFLLGTKQYMTQIFDEKGLAIVGTVISAGPVTVTALKTPEKDRYSAIQIGYGVAKAKNVSKPVIGHLKGKGPFKYIKEFRVDEANMEIGATIDVSTFAEGDVVEVSGISKGKGFQGVVKRHGFHGGPRSHGQKHSEREPGSIGGGLRTHVPKGMRMAGRMGSDRVTVKNLRVVKVLPETNELIISGAIPGRRGTLVEIKSK
jgi:large subunit ribosomal protein L3